MQNSLVAGRRTARRILLAQALSVALAAGGCLLLGPRAALSAAFGGGAVVLGTALMAWRSLGGGIRGGIVALGRLMGGLALKWLVIGLALYVALARLGLPPLPLVAGVGAALAGFVVAGIAIGGPMFAFKSRS